MAENKRQNQDGALAWLVVTTLAPHWRSLLVAVMMLLATAALNVAPPYLVQQAESETGRQGDRETIRV